MNMGNIVRAYLHDETFCQTAPLYQYDYGQILQLVGIELPTAYEVHFSNAPTGSSTTQIGNADGVSIPDMYLTSGSPVYAWLFLHTGLLDGETKYTITIPVIERAEITDDEPTPEQQSAITEAIAALNQAVDDANVAIEHYPKIEDGRWYVWDVTAGEYISTDIEAQGPQGAQGEQGDKGDTGATGTTFTPSVAPNGDLSWSNDGDRPNPATVNIKGPQGETGAAGRAGDDGFSPIVSLTKSDKTTTLSITDKSATSTVSILDGQDGAKGDTGASGVYVGTEEPTDPSQIVWIDPSGSGVEAVTDVQINGNSIINGGIANIPVASFNTPGVVRTSPQKGTYMTDENILGVFTATSSEIKAANSGHLSVPANRQHEAVFYGLAKAARDTSQAASSNAVGTYTETARFKIQQMLNAAGNYVPVTDITLATDRRYADGLLLVELPWPAKQILIYTTVASSIGTSSLVVGLYDLARISMYQDVFSGQIGTTAKTTIAEYTLMGDYVMRDYNFDNLNSQTCRGIAKLSSSSEHNYIYQIGIGVYNANATIPVGSTIRIFAR